MITSSLLIFNFYSSIEPNWLSDNETERKRNKKKLKNLTRPKSNLKLRELEKPKKSLVNKESFKNKSLFKKTSIKEESEKIYKNSGTNQNPKLESFSSFLNLNDLNNLPSNSNLDSSEKGDSPVSLGHRRSILNRMESKRKASIEIENNNEVREVKEFNNEIILSV